MDSIVPIVFLLAVTYVVVAVAKTITDTIIRLRILKSGASPELATSLAGPPSRSHALDTALQWGLATAGVGLGLIVIQFLPYEPAEPISIGILLLFAATGLLGYPAAAGRLDRGRAV